LAAEKPRQEAEDFDFRLATHGERGNFYTSSDM